MILLSTIVLSRLNIFDTLVCFIDLKRDILQAPWERWSRKGGKRINFTSSSQHQWRIRFIIWWKWGWTFRTRVYWSRRCYWILTISHRYVKVFNLLRNGNLSMYHFVWIQNDTCSNYHWKYIEKWTHECDPLIRARNLRFCRLFVVIIEMRNCHYYDHSKKLSLSLLYSKITQTLCCCCLLFFLFLRW